MLKYPVIQCVRFLLLFFAWSSFVYLNNNIILTFDQTIYEFIRDEVSLPVLNFFKIVTWLGSAWVVLCLVFFSALNVYFKKRSSIGLAWFGLISVALFINQYLKLFFIRERPVFLIEVFDTRSYSYPSGHALGGVLLAYYIFWLLKEIYPHRLRLRTELALLIGFFVPISRVMLGVHWFSDIFGGALLAFFYISLFRCLLLTQKK